MKKPFSIKRFLSIIILLSWPFQIGYFFLGESYKPLLLISMVMVGIGAFICGKWIFKDGFANAGWHWGKPKHYVFVFGLALFLWVFPSSIENTLGIYKPNEVINWSDIISGFAISALITIIPAFGVEFVWRGYLFPRLLNVYNHRKALLIHGLVTWIWHLPFIFIMGLQIDGNPWVSIPIIVVVSLIPTIMHAVVFAFIWSKTTSLAVVTAYHVFFDEIRDALQNTIGLGILGQNWQMLVLTLFGIILLYKVTWNFHFKTYSYV